MPNMDVIILGAGPAGLLCANEAARRGLRVLVVDKQDRVGRKLSMAGGGMGNITNLLMGPEHYVGGHSTLIRHALRAFPPAKALHVLDSLNIPWEERDFGQIFCLKPAAHLAQALEESARKQGVAFHLGKKAHVSRLAGSRSMLPMHPIPPVFTGEGHGFAVRSGQKEFLAPQLVLATGSPAWPQVGADEGGARLATRWGHTLLPFRPALTPLIMPQNWPLHGLEGISLNASIRVIPQNAVLPEPVTGNKTPKKTTHQNTDLPADPHPYRPLLFTHKGLSGPAALVASCFWHEGDSLCVNFLPQYQVLELLHQPENGKVQVQNLLARYLPARLAERLVPPDMAHRKSAELAKADRQRMAEAVHAHSVRPHGVEGFRKAEAAAGGISLNELNRQLQSNIVPGLYFCGEILDVTGLLGGYNIHWAFASASLAASGLTAGVC